MSEQEFATELRRVLCGFAPRAVTGPGRSGAVAAVYASHYLGVPFLPYGQECPERLRPLLIVDMASASGATLRKATRRYGVGCWATAIFSEPPRVAFWYERSVR